MVWVSSADVRTNVSELIEVYNVSQDHLQKHENPRLRVGLGKRAIQACASKPIWNFYTQMSSAGMAVRTVVCSSPSIVSPEVKHF